MELGLESEPHVATEVAECEHHPLGESCGARGVVYLGQCALVDERVFHIGAGESVGIGAAHAVVQLGEKFSGHVAVGRMLGKHFARIEGEYGLYCRHFLKLHVVENRLVGEQHHALGVIDDVHRILDVEVLKHRHDYGAIGECGHVGFDPGDGIPSHQGYLVATFHATFLEQQVGSGDASGKIGISHGRTR